MTGQIITAIPVPFTASGDVDSEMFGKALELISPHVDGALVGGTTGEFPALEDSERLDLFALAAKVLGADRVVAHLGHASSRQVLRLAGATLKLGVKRFALLSPYYLPTDDDGVVAFYRELTDAHPEAEVYAYLFPERTGMDVAPEVLGRVMELPGMVGVKLSGAANDHFDEYRAVLKPGQELFSGSDGTLPQVLARGGTGVVSGVSSAFPQTFAALAQALDAGAGAASQLQDVVAEIVSVVGATIPCTKAALKARLGGEWASRMAMPVVDSATIATIQSFVDAHK